MTKFNKEQFSYSGGYLTYTMGDERRFVARFKYSSSQKASFMSFLIRNFSVEEYFGMIDGGAAPLTVLETKGFVQPHVKLLLKANGYEVSQAGLKQYINNQVAGR